MKIIIVTGGSGGHIYPALSLADKLKLKGHQILFVGSATRMEKDVIPQKGYDFIGLNIVTTKGSFLQKVKSLLSMIFAFLKCLKLVKGYDLVIGFGNYISVPITLAAKFRKIKTALHEQNSFAGRANLFLDTKVDLVLLTYQQSLDQFKNKNKFVVGNPQSQVAYELDVDNNIISGLNLNQRLPTIVIFMGSLGSETVMKVIVEYLNMLEDKYQVVYATGINHYDYVVSHTKKNNNIKIFDKIDAISIMKNADLLISRAGATTLAEVEAIKIPSILIPSPYVPNNHQYHNAKTLNNLGCSLIIEEKNLNAKLLYETINDLIFNKEKLENMKQSFKSSNNINSINDIIEKIENL